MRRAESYLTRRRFAATLAPCVLLWLLVGGLCLFFGQEHIPARGVASILTGHGVGGPYAYIVLHVRVPRVLLGLMVGGGLAVTGTMFQALLRNPLATPHTIGVSAGGALGAALAIALGWTGPKIGPVGTVQFFALTGALINMGIIYVLAQRKEFFSPLRLLLCMESLRLPPLRYAKADRVRIEPSNVRSTVACPADVLTPSPRSTTTMIHGFPACLATMRSRIG